MTENRETLTFSTPEQTAIFARDLAETLQPGDVILLEGQIGAGKTHFSRNLIQALLAQAEDVPSPTFTLVQIYDVPTGELWHADLYRLSHADEVEELGLLAAFEEAVCLVEWPDRLQELAPTHALTLSLALVPNDEDARAATLTWTDPKWAAKLGLA